MTKQMINRLSLTLLELALDFRHYKLVLGFVLYVKWYGSCVTKVF